NGKVNFANLLSKKLETETANGPIQVTDSRILDLEAETLNGHIHTDGAFQMVDLQSFSGNIHCTIKEKGADSIEAKTATGGINLYVPSDVTAKGELRSNLGSFKIELEGLEVIEEKSEMVQKSLRFAAKDETNPRLRIYADSKTGAISLQKSL